VNALLDGRTVIVTGAGGGVGRGVALACATAGAHVVVAAPRENGAETTAAIEAAGGSAEWVRCDVTDPGDVDASVAAALERTGRLDVMVHNATSRRSGDPVRLEDVDDALFEEHVSVSLRAAYSCAIAALPQLQANRGSLVTMTSPAGMEGSLTVNTVAPLAMTPAMVHAWQEDPSLEARVTNRVPLGWLGDPEADIGPAVVFLASEGARYVTGQTLAVNGGRFMNL
jgi:3-oxoacyl-[acyl-carrier protein] reductase